ncbi:MAG TPA: hypothetical protein VEB19_10155 [Gemmatimonadaceae bacterium]|nr:hypothetical protein [Gemmatimonadaceae bacterium]
MSDTRPASPWTTSPTAKEKHALQREVTALLDELAPEKVLTRGDSLRLPIEQSRTIQGCVLQAPNAALSVSWFAGSPSDKTLGELHIVSWKGTLSQRGSASRHKGATIVQEYVFLPIEKPTDTKTWRRSDGLDMDTPSVAAFCLALLKEQMDAAEGDA